MVAGQFDPDPHGALDVGVRKGPWSAQILTDTLDIRWAPEAKWGRAWVASRTEVGAVGLLISPWDDGQPRPERGFAGSTVGGQAGVIAYLPHGFYAGVSGTAYYAWFSDLPATEVELPDPTPWLTADGLLGWWSKPVHGWLRAGVDHDRLGAAVQPHVHGTVTTDAPWRVAPLAEVRAGWAKDQSLLTRTRLGGMNPYVVPLAGAGWAEFWVERYAALRAGPRVKLETDVGAFEHGVVVDVAVWSEAGADTARAWGLGSLNRWSGDRWFVQADVGWGAGLVRVAGVSPLAAWLQVGIDWGVGGR